MKLDTLKKRLKGFAKIENMERPSYYGETAASQFIIKFDNGCVFQSFDSIIAVEIEEKVRGEQGYEKKVYLTKDWDYSKTTGKYRNKFLSEGIAETREKIKSGEYQIVN
jgi:hypothetical protein